MHGIPNVGKSGRVTFLFAVAMDSASAQWLEQLRLDLLAQRANQREQWLRAALGSLPVQARGRACFSRTMRCITSLGPRDAWEVVKKMISFRIL